MLVYIVEKRIMQEDFFDVVDSRGNAQYSLLKVFKTRTEAESYSFSCTKRFLESLDEDDQELIEELWGRCWEDISDHTQNFFPLSEQKV